jgi:NADH-quinone oxidoreductase subunit M
MDNHFTLWSDSAAFPLLTLLTLIPFTTLTVVLGSRSSAIVLWAGFGGTLLAFLLSGYLLFVFDSDNPGLQLVEQLQFAGLGYCVGVDGISVLFIPLTALLTFMALVYAFVTRRGSDRLLIACLLGYETILIGAFTALNALQFWFWCLLELIPVILLTMRGGTGQNRPRVVALLLQYWGSGLLMTLTGFMFLAFGLIDSEHALTFDWLTLKENNTYLHDETLIFILLFFGFAIRMPLFPFHGWLPLLAEHGTVASTAIFLIGLKLGIYALIRFILPLVPGVAEEWAGFVLTLAIISIFYGALLALMQLNIRRLLAFAAVSHTGMLIVGIFSFNHYGLEGSILLSLGYGLATAGMLFSVGLLYEQTHTAFISRLGGLFDTHSAIALLFLISALSTMVVPGTPGFAAAHLLVKGVIEEYGWLMVIVLLAGNVLVAVFLLRAFQKIFIATPKRFQPSYRSHSHPPAGKERIIIVAICLLLIGAGFYTTPWLNFIDQEAVMFESLYPVHGRHTDPVMEPTEGDMRRSTP